MISLIKIKNNLGFSLIEVLIACSIISLSMFALMETAQKGISVSRNSLIKSQAGLLMEEGAEAVKSIRDNSWTDISNLNLNTNYYLYFNTNTKLWTLNTNSTNLSGYIPTYPIDDVYTRSIVLSSVGRDSDDDIVASGGTIDPHTKKVTITVSWNSSSGTTSKNLSFYLFDIFN